ncbi:MAG: hypothetical protein OIF51_04630 [Cellvibrionaceae bacterium]|nr:hypothetical protein [Cellvibrionaceae bacterium]
MFISSRKVALFVLIALLPLSSKAQDEAKCHLFLKTNSSYVVGLESYVLVNYGAKNFCKRSPVKSFACYSYKEEKETCNSDNKKLIKKYLKDLVDDGKVLSKL